MATIAPPSALPMYKVAPWKFSPPVGSFARVHSAHAVRTTSRFRRTLLRVTCRLLTQANDAGTAPPGGAPPSWCKLSGTRTCDRCGCNQHSLVIVARLRMWAVVTSVTLPLASRQSTTKPKHAIRLPTPSQKGPFRIRSSGWERLRMHSACSAARICTPAHGTSSKGRVSVARASCHSWLRILQIVQCANRSKKSGKDMKNTPGVPPTGQPSRCRKCGVQLAQSSDHAPCHFSLLWGLRIFTKRTCP
mmetsp:Transcript_73404/g.224528  ORF Transcript_73404/g.224528 Transcript_73404/m.224528 type:complete len:247 (+) Transcript_73404:138-878(+)